MHFLLSFRNPLIPAHNVLRAVSRAADRDAKHRQFLLRMQVWIGSNWMGFESMLE